MRANGAILLYHGTFATVPADLGDGLHNITPDVLYDHLDTLAHDYTIVDLAEYVDAKDTDGLACVTFDDGYRCVLTEALPVFEALNIPFTLFVNGATLQGETFWRDKVRYLVEHELVADFEAFSGRIKRIGSKRFYRYSKNPANNSVDVSGDIDRYLSLKGIDNAGSGYVLNTAELLAHPLVSYGNHSHHHYVMASLTCEQQAQEIQDTALLLDQCARQSGVSVSDVFSIPFGELKDFNDETIRLANDFGYRAVALSRQRLDQAEHTLSGIRALDRFMPRATKIGADLLVAST